MKTLQSTFAIALLATSVIFNANAEEKKTEKNEAAASTTNSIANYKMSNLKVGLYEAGHVNSLKLNLTLTKDAGKTATVKLMDEKGNVLVEERISKNETAYSFRFDFSETPVGTYYVEVINGNHIVTKEVLKGKGTLSY
ncbi:hypothetical protein Emtol_2760 [Emticicia oligotrophica DSM 17448]|uniref:Secretion system C-terminal sorting domain-containing protein n=1 Tax=Emticicia oligotrophica (strain DSM 17448 / CIP 109782 / MTCC 6937 / GPTSA100-15) TaxID=929562 RepID=A0ABM5N384_EMTOG|nr:MULTISPECIES: T9SS type A sorting domain-containing protein [Emticicia]AFK03895.1 hypothetical protein Emtol_2760 [Emticicia oligotrophica DSM 17448]